MKKDQPTQEVNGKGDIPPALEPHLPVMHSRALELKTVAAALEALMEAGVIDGNITGNLASVVSSIAIDVQRGLDSFAIDRVRL